MPTREKRTPMEWSNLLCRERPRPSTMQRDHRTEFERDWDRTIFSTPVKRLQDKAQVFPLEPHDAVRTRLTHSLEVSSVARGIAMAVSKWLLDEGRIDPGMDRWIEAIAAVCGLIHDLGNPPFGHSGEDAIREWFRTRFKPKELSAMLREDEQLVQDFLKFEGNAQSLRLIAKLQILADANGLNLTYGTLSASCKYLASSVEADESGEAGHAWSKPGYFKSEQSLVEEIRSRTGTGPARNPITFIVEAADDIVYSAADVEDAVKKGVLRWREVHDFLRSAKDPDVTEALELMDTILKAGQSSSQPKLPDDAYASAFRTAAISLLVRSATEEYQRAYDEIMGGNYDHDIAEKCKAAGLLEQLKTLGRTRVYCTPSNLKLELMGRRVILDLMDVFWEGASVLPTVDPPKTKKFPGKIGALLSENYRRAFRTAVRTRTDLPEAYHRFQLVTDYVCGMTDSFAQRLHRELTNG